MDASIPESAEEAEDRERFLARVLLPEPIAVPSGVDGLELVHFMEWTQEDARPSDGHWSVTLAGRNIAVQRCKFRTLHSAANYAERIKDFVDWTGPHDEWTKGEQGIEFSKKLSHAEAHAHEIDAVYPPGNWVPFSNGPAILDDDGTTRQFLSQAPSLDWTKDDEGTHRCTECGELPVLRMEWMD
jgi:hypothetical protein